MDDEALGKLLAEVHRDYADYRRPEGVCVSPSSMSVMVDRTGEPVERSDSDNFGFSVRNMYSAQNQFPAITQTERMVDRTEKPVEGIAGIAEERETPTSTTLTPWKITCATPPRGATTPTTSPSPSQVMSPTTRSSTSSSTPRVSFSYVTPSSDLDIDDTTLGKLLTEAHRGQADYCEPEGVSVSQSSSSVVFDGAGKPDGERNVDQSIGFGVTRNTYSAHSKFLKTPKLRKWSIEQGNLWEKTAQVHRLGPSLMNRDR